MPRTLYMTIRSPGARAVLMAAEALGISLEKKEVDIINGEQLTPRYLQMNPQHTVPTLDDNGFIIWDSHAILVYLVDKYAKGNILYSDDVEVRAKINQRLHFDTGVAFPLLMSVARPIKMMQTKTVPTDKIQLIHEAYSFLEKFLEGQHWVAGSSTSIADLSLVATISTLDFFIPTSNYPNITAWLKRCEDLPYNTQNRLGLENFRIFFSELMK